VATDFSPTSEGAWFVARRLAGHLGAEIVILHVLVEAPLSPRGRSPWCTPGASSRPPGP